MFNILSTPGGWDEAEFFATGEREIAHVLGRLDELGIERPTGRALDFGCGVGRLTLALADRFDHVDGVDISPEMIALAEGHPGCEFHVNDEPDLALFADDTFDFVYSFIALQHMARELAEGYVREFVRVLKPGGVAVFQVPEGPDSTHNDAWVSMRGTDPETVKGWVEAEVIDVESSPAGPWMSHRYFIRK